MRRVFLLFMISLVHLWNRGGEMAVGQESEDPVFVQYLSTWGEKGEAPGQFRNPQSISVDPAGFLYIADTGNQRIQKLDSSGKFVAEIGGFGWEREQFDHPMGISCRNGLDVLVADHYNQRIERYDKDLHYLASFTSSEDWSEHLRFGFPLDVDLSSQGELYCLDGENHRVLKLDVLGNPQLSFGDFDAGEGRLVKPQQLFISDVGRVYVSDEEEHRIVVFDIHGNYLHHFGGSILDRPMGMAGMPGDVILAADGDKKCVFVFHPSGVLLGNFGKEPGIDVSFGEPVDVACWRDRVYVLDKKRHGVAVFQWIFRGEKDRR